MTVNSYQERKQYFMMHKNLSIRIRIYIYIYIFIYTQIKHSLPTSWQRLMCIKE